MSSLSKINHSKQKFYFLFDCCFQRGKMSVNTFSGFFAFMKDRFDSTENNDENYSDGEISEKTFALPENIERNDNILPLEVEKTYATLQPAAASDAVDSTNNIDIIQDEEIAI